MVAYFNGFTISITRDQAYSCSHSGDCEEDVYALMKNPRISRQLDAIDPASIRAELKEYGAWDRDELADEYANRARILWIACGNIRDEAQGARR